MTKLNPKANFNPQEAKNFIQDDTFKTGKGFNPRLKENNSTKTKKEVSKKRILMKFWILANSVMKAQRFS